MTSSTPPTTTTIERARARIVEQHIHLAARGTVKATQQRFFLVNGTHDTYTVLVEAHALTCTCPARGVCKHRVLVHDLLAAECEQRRTAQAATDAAAAEMRRTAPLRRDNRAFSLYR